MEWAIILMVVIIIGQYIYSMKALFKISYYEAKLVNRDVDISRVKNISLWDVFFKDL